MFYLGYLSVGQERITANSGRKETRADRWFLPSNFAPFIFVRRRCFVCTIDCARELVCSVLGVSLVTFLIGTISHTHFASLIDWLPVASLREVFLYFNIVRYTHYLMFSSWIMVESTLLLCTYKFHLKGCFSFLNCKI